MEVCKCVQKYIYNIQENLTQIVAVNSASLAEVVLNHGSLAYSVTSSSFCIVANCPGISGTVPDILPVSRKGPESLL